MSRHGKAHIAVRQRKDHQEIAFYGRRAGTLTRVALVRVPLGDKTARREAIEKTLTALRE